MDAASLLKLLAATLVLPTTLYTARRSRHPSRSGQRLTGWWCLWAGQLAALMILSAWLAVIVGQDCMRLRQPVPAVIYGGLGALFAGLTAVHAVRLFRLGLSILRRWDPGAIQRSAQRLQAATVVPLLGCMALYWLASFVVPIPGRFTPAIFLVGVLMPVGFTASLVFVVAGFAAQAHRGRRP